MLPSWPESQEAFASGLAFRSQSAANSFASVVERLGSIWLAQDQILAADTCLPAGEAKTRS